MTSCGVTHAAVFTLSPVRTTSTSAECTRMFTESRLSNSKRPPEWSIFEIDVRKVFHIICVKLFSLFTKMRMGQNDGERF